MKNYREEWWFPRKVGKETAERLREDYSNTEEKSDEELLWEFGYATHKYENPALWDHVGDASEAYEKLADAFLELLEEYEEKYIWGKESE